MIHVEDISAPPEESKRRGHGGIRKTFTRLAANFYWHGMRQDVTSFVNKCVVCQEIKSATTLPAGLLCPLPVPAQIWEDLSMDFITGLPTSRGYTTILVVVDRLSKYAHFGPLPLSYSAPKVAELFTSLVIRLHGFPKTIVSDRDSIFLSTFWRHLFALSGTTLQFSTAYHPQTDGQTEVLNRCLEQYLRAYTSLTPKLWSNFLCWAELCYNTSFHSTIKMTPYQAVYGRLPPSIPSYVRGKTTVAEVDNILLERDALLRTLRQNILQAQNRMKLVADKHRREVEFNIGEWVMVKLQPYRQTSVTNRAHHKLAKRFFGPFHITSKISSVVYRLELPADSKIHPVFHISVLKSFKGSPPDNPVSLPPICFNNFPVSLPESILASRTVSHRAISSKQVLLKWTCSDISDATWEKFSTLCLSFPSLNLEDKVSFHGDGSVKKQLIPLEQEIIQRQCKEWIQHKEANEASEEQKENIQATHQQSSRQRKAPRWLQDYVQN